MKTRYKKLETRENRNEKAKQKPESGIMIAETRKWHPVSRNKKAEKKKAETRKQK